MFGYGTGKDNDWLDAFDRVLAVNAIGTLIILGIALHGFIMERPEFVDIALLYAILNFIGTFAVLKFSTGQQVMPRHPGRNDGRAIVDYDVYWIFYRCGIVALLIGGLGLLPA